MKYTPTIGLEIHAELKTKTKMFCSSPNNPDDERPNVNICPVCMAHPGTLPVINREAVKHVLRVGLAIGGERADYTEFDRKNYFYPDLPKGYQISQYEFPLISGGELRSVAITRIHLEEDTARSIHDDANDSTLVDYNRAGVPLMELVTEPVIRSAEQAGAFARELQLLLRTLQVSEANMEKGEMRVEANISVVREGSDPLSGTKVEIKNLNSFRSMERAVAYEIERQTEALESGEEIIQETRGWDEVGQKTYPQRIKEGSADYRYFPDPDLPSLRISEISEFAAEVLADSMPELPWERRARYVGLGVSEEDAELYVRDATFGSFFDAVAAELEGSKGGEMVRLASNYIASDLVKLIRDLDNRDAELSPEISISARNFAKLIEATHEGKLSSRGAKNVLSILFQNDGDPVEIAEREGLLQESGEDTLLPLVDGVLAAHPAVVQEYKDGKEEVLKFLVGQGMKETKGSANPQVLSELFKKQLDS